MAQRMPPVTLLDTVNFQASTEWLSCRNIQSKSTVFEWGYEQTGPSAGPVAWTFAIDTNYDGVADLIGNTTQITDAAGAVQCNAISEATKPITANGWANGFSHEVYFPTACIREYQQVGDVIMGVTAGGVAESITVDAVAFPPAS